MRADEIDIAIKERDRANNALAEIGFALGLPESWEWPDQETMIAHVIGLVRELAEKK